MFKKTTNKYVHVLSCITLWVITFPALTPAEGAIITVAQDGSGDFTLIQDALDATQSGDVVIIHQGSYIEDISVGRTDQFDMFSETKSDLTVMAAEGEHVEVIAANKSNRANGWEEALGADFGESDLFGFEVASPNSVIDGLRIVQDSKELDAFSANFALPVFASNVTIKNCDIVGPGTDVRGIGLILSTEIDLRPVYNLRVEHCTFSNFVNAFQQVDFLRSGNQHLTSTIVDCEFYDNVNGILSIDGDTTIDSCLLSNNETGMDLQDGKHRISNTVVKSNAAVGIEINEVGFDGNEPLGGPAVSIDNCLISDNGFETDAIESFYVPGVFKRYGGVVVSIGTVNITKSILSNNGNTDLLLHPLNYGISSVAQPPRISVETGLINVTLNHCDLYQSTGGTSIKTSNDPKVPVFLTITNTNIGEPSGEPLN